jgi:large subunit ribosomal protein L30
MYAVIRVRGKIHVKKEIKDTLNILRLNRVNHCVLIPKTPRMEGMIKKVKDWVTWGEISQKTLEILISKRGRLLGNKKPEGKELKDILDKIKKEETLKSVKNLKPVFRLNPPRKGYKNIKQAFPRGALGYRGEKINELIERMI